MWAASRLTVHPPCAYICAFAHTPISALSHSSSSPVEIIAVIASEASQFGVAEYFVGEQRGENGDRSQRADHHHGVNRSRERQQEPRDQREGDR